MKPLRKITATAAFALTCLLAAPAARAWNDTGHKVIALIAWQELKPEVRARLTALLECHPQYAQKLKAADATRPEAAAQAAFLAAACWPDMVRAKTPENQPYHHGAWHYIDFPYVRGTLPNPRAAETPETHWKPGTDPANALQALEKCTADLKNPAASAADKALAIAWIEHVVGDVHMPLHAVSWFSEQFPDGDRGGNLVMVNAGGRVTSLHALWDDMLGKDSSLLTVQHLTASIRHDFPRQQLAESLEKRQAADWVRESFETAKTVAYQKGEIPFISKAQFDADKNVTVQALSQAYLENGRRAAEQRIALAGYRLADCLNALLGDTPSSSPSSMPAEQPKD